MKLTRPAPKPWGHRHRLLPLWETRGTNPSLLVGYQCADLKCDELFTPNGNVSNATPRANDTRPMAQLGREGVNHKARRLARSRRAK